MRFIKDMCIIHEWPWYWYSTNKSIYHHKTPGFLLRNKNREVRLAIIRDEWHFNYVCQLFAHIICNIQICVSFRNGHGTDTWQTSPFATLECPNSCSDLKQGLTFGYKERWVAIQFCLPSVCTHHMRDIKDVCIIYECTWCWYFTNKSVYNHKTPILLLRLLWNKNRDVCLDIKRGERLFNYVY